MLSARSIGTNICIIAMTGNALPALAGAQATPPILQIEEAPLAALAPVAPAAPEATANAALDIEGMRRSVRDVGIGDSPARPSTSVFSGAPSTEVQRFQRKFNDGKRGWCLTAFQGMGVLALVAMPLAALLDKKDHGCKW